MRFQALAQGRGDVALHPGLVELEQLFFAIGWAQGPKIDAEGQPRDLGEREYDQLGRPPSPGRA